MSSAKRNQPVVAARISGDFHSAIFFRFPALSRPELALSVCRLRVSQANFAIKQSDARTAIVMTVKKGKERKGRDIEPVRAQVTTNLKRRSFLMRAEEERFRGASRLLHDALHASSVFFARRYLLKVDRPYAR